MTHLVVPISPAYISLHHYETTNHSLTNCIMSRNEEYIVEAIRGWRYHYDEGCIQFFIKWQGYSEIENTWEPVDNLNCPDILQEFIKNLPSKQARYFHVDQHEKLTGFQRNATFQACLGADGPHDSDDEDSVKPEKQPFYCLIKFDDSDLVFEVTLKEFMAYLPEKAFEFLEERILIKADKRRQENADKTSVPRA